MATRAVENLTPQDITDTAKSFRDSRQKQKWTVIVDGQELPARALVLAAAGVLPNDTTNSHQAVARLKGLGFDTRYMGQSV